MAYMSQEKKAKIAPRVKAILKKYGLKGSLSVRNHSTLCLTVKSGKIDFIQNLNRVCGANHFYMANGFKPVTDKYLHVNEYHFRDHFDGKAKQFLAEVLSVMNDGNHDRSDIMTDYFDVGWYTNVNIGKWDKPYELV